MYQKVSLILFGFVNERSELWKAAEVCCLRKPMEVIFQLLVPDLIEPLFIGIR